GAAVRAPSTFEHPAPSHPAPDRILLTCVMNRSTAIAVVVALALGAARCSKPESAQARSADGAARPVAVAVVHKDSVRRAVDVVGTLAAVDQVTVSSEADGRVSAILADLGDRVKSGQVLVRLDREKQQYTY